MSRSARGPLRACCRLAPVTHLALLLPVLALACSDAGAPPAFKPSDASASERHASSQAGPPRSVRDVFDQRCVVCHSCYDAPCQLNLASQEGIERGATAKPVYDARRLMPIEPTRLGVDAQGIRAWRKRGFHDVLRNEHGVGGGLMLAMLDLGLQAGFRPGQPLPADFPLDIQRDLSCPTQATFEAYANATPQGGMPYGMTPLAEEDLALIGRWLRQDAPPPASPPALSLAVATQVAAWEEFLNGKSLKARITARYLYEHWFVSHLYFRSTPEGPFFRAVRSSTPPGSAIRQIATRRPYDDPGEAPFWYRLERIRETIVHKTHIVYPLDDARRARLRSAFLDSAWEPTRFPSYAIAKASNPFVTFAEVPARARAEFLLDDARHFISTFIRGPVCRGQVAVDVIEDRFWIAFLDPDYDLSVTDPSYLERAKKLLDLPAEHGSLALPGGLWADHAAHQVAYLNLRRKAYAATDPEKRGPSLDYVWNGVREGPHEDDPSPDPDALLTVFRHFDNATVEQGLIGSVPETAWIIDYPIFERIYYDLVAGFDVFGNIAHQAATRLYMDHLRMQSENNLLAFLPEKARKPLRDSWYLGATNEIHQRFINRPQSQGHGTQIRFESQDYVAEFFDHLMKRSPATPGTRDPINRCPAPSCTRSGASERENRIEDALRPLASTTGAWVQFLPELSWLRVEPDGRDEPALVYTLIHDRAHTNVASMFNEDDRLQPELDELTLVPGMLGSYPNFFFEVAEGDVSEFRRAMMALRDRAALAALVDRFGVRRTDERFWLVLDTLHRALERQAPTEWGIVDLGRYENL